MAEGQHHRGSARMFKSDFLEWFSHVHPATPAVLYLPVVAVSLYLAITRYQMEPVAIAGRFIGGYVLWTLAEYWLHRLVFHLEVKGPRSERIYFYLHGVHHDWPWDTTRLVMPPAASLAIAVIVFSIFWVFSGPAMMFPMFAGFILGYVIYDSVHWYAHAGKPTTRLGKLLRREHLVHHFKDPGSRFGVSCPFWDHIFGTTGKPVRDRRTETVSSRVAVRGGELAGPPDEHGPVRS